MSLTLPSWGPAVPADCSAEVQCRVWWEGLFLSLRLPPSGLKPLTSACKQLLASRLAGPRPGLECAGAESSVPPARTFDLCPLLRLRREPSVSR